ncbi:MAG: ClpXP protease specificity-enhancing factor SspB [Ascidiaceihabitans sp.]|nr:ClpXP protease specificity-enhancing factor SspB [Ascidiaceihabitans sp.]
MSDTIDYGNLMHDAMRSLIKRVLTDVQANGLPGSHHFFITFRTTHPDAELADWLSDRYPEEMTVVMQHWFDRLEVGEDGFGIRLNFGDAPEPLFVPYDAIKTFVDPSVEFGLRFEAADDEDVEFDGVSVEELGDSEPVQMPEPKPSVLQEDDADDEAPKAAEVVSLDSFRK